MPNTPELDKMERVYFSDEILARNGHYYSALESEKQRLGSLYGEQSAELDRFLAEKKASLPEDTARYRLVPQPVYMALSRECRIGGGGFKLPGQRPKQQEAKSSQEAEDIARGVKPCVNCDTTGYIWREGFGLLTGVKVWLPEPCICTLYREFYKIWWNSHRVPPKHADVRARLLNTDEYRSRFRRFNQNGGEWALLNLIALGHGLAPSHAMASAKGIKKDWRPDCLLLTGPADTGKSTFLMAIYARVMAEWVAKVHLDRMPNVDAVWYVNAHDLANEQRLWEMRSLDGNDSSRAPVSPPRINIEAINAAVEAGHKPWIFIEEMDKYKHSEFQNRGFFRLFDRVYEVGGGIVVTSNLNPDMLLSLYGEQYGLPTLRRIMGGPQGAWIDFARGVVHPNYSMDPYKNGTVHTAYLSTSNNSTRASGMVRGSVPLPPQKPVPEPLASPKAEEPEPSVEAEEVTIAQVEEEETPKQARARAAKEKNAKRLTGGKSAPQIGFRRSRV